MATLRNKRKLAAVSRKTPDSSRGKRGRNVLDPELTQDYISQVSEEIEGRVTKKLSKEFNKTESRILGALSKLDEFLLNPQVRTCSVFQGASRNANSENREIHGDRSSTDPYPEGGYFPHHSGQLNSSEADMVTETYPHTVQKLGRVNMTNGSASWSHNSASEPAQWSSFLSGGLALVVFGCERLFLSFGEFFTLNSEFIPIFLRCLAKILWYSTKIISTARFSASVSCVFVQSNHSKYFILDSALSIGFCSSFSFDAFTSLRLRVWFGV